MSAEKTIGIMDRVGRDGLERALTVNEGERYEVLCRCDGTLRAVQDCMNAVEQFQTPTLKGCGLEAMQVALRIKLVEIDEPERAHNRLRALIENKQLCALGGMARLIERMP